MSVRSAAGFLVFGLLLLGCTDDEPEAGPVPAAPDPCAGAEAFGGIEADRQALWSRALTGTVPPLPAGVQIPTTATGTLSVWVGLGRPTTFAEVAPLVGPLRVYEAVAVQSLVGGTTGKTTNSVVSGSETDLSRAFARLPPLPPAGPLRIGALRVVGASEQVRSLVREHPCEVWSLVPGYSDQPILSQLSDPPVTAP